MTLVGLSDVNLDKILPSDKELSQNKLTKQATILQRMKTIHANL